MRNRTLIPESGLRTLVTIAVLGLLVLVAGLFVNPERIWASWLVALVLLAGLGLAGPVFIAIHRLCAARWAEPFLGVPRAMSASLPLAAAWAVLVVFGLSSLFEWSHAAFLESHPLVEGKRAWLNAPSFLGRGLVIFAIWILTARWMLRRPGRASASVFIILFAVTFSVFSFDWIMSLEPEWFSTMFGVYNFSGLFLAGLAALTLLVLRGQREGALSGVDSETLHDLGRLLFAFSFFWGYIWYCQYMLIWYTNIPEETAWFARRHTGSWATLSLLNLFLNFLVPFVVLLPATAKRSPRILGRIAAVLLVGRWLDLYIMITPATAGERPPLGLWEIGPPIAVLAAFFAVTGSVFARSATRSKHGTESRDVSLAASS